MWLFYFLWPYLHLFISTWSLVTFVETLQGTYCQNATGMYLYRIWCYSYINIPKIMYICEQIRMPLVCKYTVNDTACIHALRKWHLSYVYLEKMRPLVCMRTENDSARIYMHIENDDTSIYAFRKWRCLYICIQNIYICVHKITPPVYMHIKWGPSYIYVQKMMSFVYMHSKNYATCIYAYRKWRIIWRIIWTKSFCCQVISATFPV